MTGTMWFISWAGFMLAATVVILLLLDICVLLREIRNAISAWRRNAPEP